MVEAKEKTEVQIKKVSEWETLVQSFDSEIKTPQDLQGFFSRKQDRNGGITWPEFIPRKKVSTRFKLGVVLN